MIVSNIVNKALATIVKVKKALSLSTNIYIHTIFPLRYWNLVTIKSIHRSMMERGYRRNNNIHIKTSLGCQGIVTQVPNQLQNAQKHELHTLVNILLHA